MFGVDRLEGLFVLSSFFLQGALLIHFAVRKWRFDTAIRYGPVVYALGIPAALVSIILLAGGKTWALWLGGFLYLLWALYGYTVEYVKKIEWRTPIRWSIFGPYVCLYLATIMFYWFPLGLIRKPLWYAYALLFVASTLLNISSHNRPGERT